MADQSHKNQNPEMILNVGQAFADATPTSETPFRVAVLGNFTGSITKENLFKTIRVDRDNFEELPATLKVCVELQYDNGSTLTLSLASMDDFHPDHLFNNLSIFEKLRGLRRRLHNDNTVNQAIADMRSLGMLAEETTSSSSAPEQEPAPRGNLLDQILDHPEGQSAVPVTPENEWQSLIKAMVRPFSLQTTEAEKKAYLEIIDHAVSDVMRQILHHPKFQALESTWRGFQFLVDRLETDRRLQLFLINCDKADPATNIAQFQKKCVEVIAPDEEQPPWALLVGLYRFEATEKDIATLADLGKLAAALHAPFVSHAAETFFNCSSLANANDPDDWQLSLPAEVSKSLANLRQQSAAESLCLTAPRMLLRLPYGKNTNATEQFAFQEMAESNRHVDYLWGNGACAVAWYLANNFQNDGWRMNTLCGSEIGSMPVHYHKEDGETVAKSCAETELLTRALEKIHAAGLTVLINPQNSDTLRVPKIQSMAMSGHLRGRWDQ